MNDDRRERADALADEAARLFDAVEAVTGVGAPARPARPARHAPAGKPAATSRPAQRQPAQRTAPADERAVGDEPTADDEGAEDAFPDERPAASPGAGHPSTCTWCPVCRGVDTLRAVDPDTVARLADAVSMLATALGELAGTLRERIPVPRPDAKDGERGAGDGSGSGERAAYGKSAAGAPGVARDGLDAAWSRGGGGGRGAAYDIPVLGEEEN